MKIEVEKRSNISTACANVSKLLICIHHSDLTTMAGVPPVNGVPNVKGRPTYYVYNPHPQLYVGQSSHPSMYPQAYAIQPAMRPTLSSGTAQTMTNVTEVSETEEAVFR